MKKRSMIFSLLILFISAFFIGYSGVIDGDTQQSEADVVSPPEQETVQEVEQQPTEEVSQGPAKVKEAKEVKEVKTWRAEELKALVEAIKPMEQRPTLSEEELKAINAKLWDGMDKEQRGMLTDQIAKCSGSLSKVVVDNRYLELVDKSHARWDAYEANRLFGVNTYIENLLTFVQYEPLIEDLKAVEGFVNYALENRDVAAIIDANRILQDLRRFFTHGEYYVSDGNLYDAEKGMYVIGEASDGAKVVAYDDKRYYGTTKTLNGETKVISNFEKAAE